MEVKPEFLRSSAVINCTGLGVSKSARLMSEPVTTTVSSDAAGDVDCDCSCACAAPAAPISTAAAWRKARGRNPRRDGIVIPPPAGC
jgi:hypothetical protein